MYKNEKLPPVPNAITAVKQQQPQQPENSNSSRSRRKNPGAASKNCTSQKPRRGVSELFLSGGVQDQRDHLDRLADSLDGMALSITAVVHIAGLYVNDRAVVVVLAASGEDVLVLRVALMRVQADLASGIHGRVTEYAPLVLHFLRSVQKASHSDLANTVKGRRFPDADLIITSSDHNLPSCICILCS